MTPTSNTQESSENRSVLKFARKFKDSGLALVEQGTQSALNFVTMLLISKICGLEALGFYATGRFLMLLVGGMQNSLISFPYTIFFRQEESKSSTYARHHLVACIGFGAIVSLLFVVAGGSALLVTSSDLGSTFAICLVLAFATPMYLLREFSRRHEFAHLRTQAAMWLGVLTALLQVCGLVVLYWFSMLNVTTAFLLIGFSCLVANLVWLGVRAREFTKLDGDAETIGLSALLRNNWKVGKWIFSTQTVVDLLILAIQSLLVFMVDPKAGGVFAACFAVVSLCNPIVRGLSNLLTPGFAKIYASGSNDSLVDSVTTSSLRFAVLLFGLGVFIVLFGDLLVVLFYDKPIEQLTHLLAVLAMAMLAQAAGLPAVHALNVISQPQRAFMPRVLGVILATLFLVFWGFSLRELGAAYGLLIANVVITGLTLHQFFVGSQKPSVSKSSLASI